VKAGASAVEPMAVEDSEGWLRWNIDKGNQSNGGKAASVLGNIAKEGDSTNNFVRLLRTNRSAKLSATSAADGSLWIFFGTDSGFEGATSVYFTRATVVATPPILSGVAGDFLGNFKGDPLRGQTALKIGKGGSFSGTMLTPAGRIAFREKFSPVGVASVPFSSPQGTLSLSLKTSGLGDGKWDVGDEVFVEAVLQIGEEEISFELRPAARKGGPSAPLAARRINTLLESLGKSGVDFGHGFAGAAVGKDGAVRFTGSLADGAKLAGAVRLVENGSGGWKLPVALPLAAVKGFLHGEAAVVSSPGADGFHLESSVPWSWIRPANPKAKSYAAGFQEELDVKGRVWTWTKGTSALGGTGGNFTLAMSFGNTTGGFVPVPGLENLQGRFGADNKPFWSAGPPPKGFSMRITPATGLFSGKIPGTRNGKSAAVSYQGMLFSDDMPIGADGSVRGAGFVSGFGSASKMEIVIP
jgi:hypothetical protein